MVLMTTWLCNTIKLMAYVINNVFGCNKLCHLLCDFYHYVIRKDNDFLLLQKRNIIK
jgi:hypothetical protein